MEGGGGGHPDPEIKGDPASKFFFRPFGSHFGLKIKEGGRAPPLDPPRGWIFFLTGRWGYYYTGGLISSGRGVLSGRSR